MLQLFPKLIPNQIKNYPDMLSVLANFLFLQIATWTLIFATRNELLETIISKINSFIIVIPALSKVPAAKISIYIAGLLIALVFSALKLHDKISDLIKLRSRFDLYHILIPICALTDANLTPEKLDRVKISRRLVMQNVFYKYASSGAETKSVVDSHNIVSALTNWGWHWTCLESQLLHITISAAALYLGYTDICIFALFIFVVLSAMRHYFYGRAIENAVIQVNQIVGNSDANAEISKYIETL